MLSRLKKEVCELARLLQIIFVLFKYNILLLFFLKSKGLPVALREAMDELGGTFVKLGQLLSLRPDLIPNSFCSEFRKLQDNVKPFPTSAAREVIESELRKPLDKLFRKFYSRPVASASFGQVYRAVLKDGREVAIKVERPGIRQLVDTDIAILYNLARIASLKVDKDIINPVDVVREFEGYTHEELDYLNEASNIEEFCRLFRADRNVKIPSVYRELTTSRVLTMEYIRGKELNKLSKKELRKYGTKRVLKNVVYAVFRQLFEHGTFHADPHPGNIIVMNRNRIAFLDFGIVGRQDDALRKYAADTFAALLSRDTGLLADSLIGLGIAKRDVDRAQLESDLSGALGKYYGASFKEMKLGALAEELIGVAKRNGIRLPADFVLLGKAIITLEGLAEELSPELNFVEFSQPYFEKMQEGSGRFIISRIIGRYMKADYLRRFPEKVISILSTLEKGTIRVEHSHAELAELSSSIRSSGMALSIGIMAAALIVASTMLLSIIGEPKVFNIGLPSFAGYVIALLLMLKLLSIKR